MCDTIHVGVSLLGLQWVCLEIQAKMEERVDHQDEENQERVQNVKHLLIRSQVTIPALGELNEPVTEHEMVRWRSRFCLHNHSALCITCRSNLMIWPATPNPFAETVCGAMGTKFVALIEMSFADIPLLSHHLAANPQTSPEDISCQQQEGASVQSNKQLLQAGGLPDAILWPDADKDGSDEVADNEHHQCHQADDEQSFAQGLVLGGPVIRDGCAGPCPLQSQGQQLDYEESPNHCLGLHLPQPARMSAPL